VDSVGFVPHGAGVMDYFDHVGGTTWEVVDFPKPIEVEERELTDEEIEHFRKLVAERYQREGCL
jgi:lipoate-protein ligase A